MEHKKMCRRQAKTRGHKIWQMPGKNPNVRKTFGQIFLLLFNSSAERESTNIKLTCPKHSYQNQLSIVDLTRNSTLLKAAPKYPPGSSVNSTLIKPFKRIKVSPKKFGQPSQRREKTLVIFAVKSKVNLGQTIPITSIPMSINAASKDRIYALKKQSQCWSKEPWSSLVCFPKIRPANNSRISASYHTCDVERSCLQAVRTNQERRKRDM